MMKREICRLALLLFAGIAMISCEKGITDEMAEQENTTDGNVVIQVRDIETGWDGSVSRAMVSISEVCTRLQFAVYKNGEREASKNQVKGDDDFGTFSLQLEEGSYQVLILAHSAKKNITTTDPTKLQFTNPESSSGTGFSDTFYYYGNIEVTEEGARLTANMKRATSMFRLVTSDVKPAKVKKFWFYYEGGSGALNVVTGFGCVNSKQVVIFNLDDSQTGKPLEFDLFTFLHNETGSVTFTVRAFDEKDDILFSREFTNVPMERNHITRFTGNFFTDGTPDLPEDPDTPDNPDTPEDPDDPDTPDNPNDPDTPDNPADPEDPTNPDPDVNPSNVIMVDPEWGGVTDYTF